MSNDDDAPVLTPLKLNVGGTRFHTSVEAMTKGRARGSKLHAWFSKPLLGSSDTEGFFFLDHDPTAFRLILSWLKTGSASFLDLEKLDIVMLANEADFFKLTELSQLANQFLEQQKPSAPPPLSTVNAQSSAAPTPALLQQTRLAPVAESTYFGSCTIVGCFFKVPYGSDFCSEACLHSNFNKWIPPTYNIGTITDRLCFEAIVKLKYGETSTAVKLLTQAANQGHSHSSYKLGSLYATDPVALNKAEAAKFYKMAADRGHAGAQVDLGYMHSHGDGIPVDKAEAGRLFQLAADQGNEVAQFNLAEMYNTGDSVPVNKAEAYRFYKLAAYQGDQVSQYHLGVMHEKGDGIPVDKSEAKRLFKLSADRGHEKAKEALKRFK